MPPPAGEGLVAGFDDAVPEWSDMPAAGWPDGEGPSPSFVQVADHDGVSMLSLKVVAHSKMTSGSGAQQCQYAQCKCTGLNYKAAKTGHGAKCTMHGHKQKW